jgi:hypothetical protein
MTCRIGAVLLQLADAVVMAAIRNGVGQRRVSEPIPGRAGEVGLDVAWKWGRRRSSVVDARRGVSVLGAARILVPPRDGTTLDPGLWSVRFSRCTLGIRSTVVMDMSQAEQLAV